jgi:dTDP-4-dehydrorhamnose 3,5-epimerase
LISGECQNSDDLVGTETALYQLDIWTFKRFRAAMEIKPLNLVGLVLLRARRFDDERGYFVETHNTKRFNAAGIAASFVQDNQSYSARRGTIRGFHFQQPPQAQAKLVRVLHGRIYDVAVDLRLGSPSYGRWVGEILSAEGGEQLFIPRGFAHAFCTLEPDTMVFYKVDAFYAPSSEGGLIWNDPTLAVKWPVPVADVVLSDKDRTYGRFAEFSSPFQFAER